MKTEKLRFMCGSRSEAGTSRVLLRSGIAAFGAVASDHSQFSQHGNPISEGMDLRAWLIGPVHWNFSDIVSPLSRHIEQFEIEAIGIDGGAAEEVLRDSPAEQLEAALRVGDSFEAAPLHDGIEQVAQHRSV